MDLGAMMTALNSGNASSLYGTPTQASTDWYQQNVTSQPSYTPTQSAPVGNVTVGGGSTYSPPSGFNAPSMFNTTPTTGNVTVGGGSLSTPTALPTYSGSSGLPSKVTSHDLPDYITAPSTDLSGFLQDYYASMLDPNTGIVGGYGQNRVAGIDPLQQSALAQVPNAVGAWGGLFNQGTNAMNLGLQRTNSLGQYDPNQMQQHLNPYLGGVLSQIEQMGNRNLSENVLPGVNSTFAGAGQFGSTRNADFTNRALRDNQQLISNAQATALNQAYDQASKDYLSWNNAGQSAAGQLGVLGTGLTQSALSGGQQNWNDISNAYKMGEANRAISQEGLTAGYEDWQNKWKMPMDAATSMAGILSQLKQGVQGTNYTINADPQQDSSAPWYSALESVLGQVLSGNT